jgi:hypothetical protein
MVAHGYNGDPGTFNSTKNGNLFSFFLRHCQLLDPLSKRTKIPPNTTAFLRRENCNFITIDWTELASGFDYPLIVVRNIPLAASEIGYVNIIKTQYLSSTRTICFCSMHAEPTFFVGLQSICRISLWKYRCVVEIVSLDWIQLGGSRRRWCRSRNRFGKSISHYR